MRSHMEQDILIPPHANRWIFKQVGTLFVKSVVTPNDYMVIFFNGIEYRSIVLVVENGNTLD